MKGTRSILAVAALSAVFALGGSSAFAQSQCLPGIGAVLSGPHAAAYTLVRTTLLPAVPTLTTRLDATVDAASYNILLSISHTLANSIANGRLLITVPDGTVVVDTGKPDDPGNTLPQGNSWEHYQAKTVNENHNSRVAIISAQQYPCGLGVESKLSTTTGFVESYVAYRLGAHLDSSGTARLSTH